MLSDFEEACEHDHGTRDFFQAEPCKQKVRRLLPQNSVCQGQPASAVGAAWGTAAVRHAADGVHMRKTVCTSQGCCDF